MVETSKRSVTRLLPAPQVKLDLEGLYLDPALGPPAAPDGPFVYTNFIASLDGRIAVEKPRGDGRSVPPAIANPRDWRLYQELAARADVLVLSARFLRELAAGKDRDLLPLSRAPAYRDLRAWRRDQGRTEQPALAVLSRSLDIPTAVLCDKLEREVYVAVGAGADRTGIRSVEATGARVLTVGEGAHVDGRALVAALAAEGLNSIYSIAGPGVLETLLRGGVLDRLYLTQVHRLLGGVAFDTLLEGPPLDPPASFTLRALLHDPEAAGSVGQVFAVYDVLQPPGAGP